LPNPLSRQTQFLADAVELPRDAGEVQEAGDWAYEVGGFATTAPGGATLNAGKYIVIWKRQPSGAWKIYRDIFQWDVAPVETPT